ncbi:Retrotransposon gag protein [Rhizoctonia solani]|uniref:Retrotransposon gag protein n=1 Tax=Rhizoctonia solani TaxID=456999 RepID=A0A8H8NWD0_9AGAM|nr:Retrotransposon gag protein [Rhizoctonia solani]QRW20755.1 Retrotransposon gag protein [Rhizoctonia solani]
MPEPPTYCWHTTSGLEPEPTLVTLLEAITALSATVGSLQDQIKSHNKQITRLLAICRETNNLVSNGDQKGTQGKPGPPTGPITPPTHTGGEANTPGTIRLGLRDPFHPIRSTVGYNSEEEHPREERPRKIKKEPCGLTGDLRALTPVSSGADTKCPKMELPDPFKGDIRGQKAVQWLDWMLLWGALHWDQFEEDKQMIVWILYHLEDKAANWSLPIIATIIKGKANAPTIIPSMTACFKEAFEDPDAKQATAQKIATLTQTASTAEYVTKFHNLIAELDWNKETYIAQFTHSLHWKVKELLL